MNAFGFIRLYFTDISDIPAVVQETFIRKLIVFHAENAKSSLNVQPVLVTLLSVQKATQFLYTLP